MAESKDLLQVLWSGADVLRGKMDANEYKTYLINECIIRKAISENEDKNETVEEPTNKKKNKKECIIF